MTITAINEDWRGNTSTQQLGAVRESTRHLVVITDQWTSPEEIRKDSRLPIDGHLHPLDAYQYCTNVRIEPRDNTRTVFDVTVEYSSEVDDQDLELSKKGGTGIPPNPFDDPPEIEGDWAERAVPLWADRLTGEVPRIATGDIYDPPPMKSGQESVLRVTRNEAEFSYDSHVRPWQGKVNATPFYGAPKGDVLLRRVSWRRMFERGVRYFQITREFAYRNWFDNRVPFADYIKADRTPATGADVTGWCNVIPHVGYYEMVENPVGTSNEGGALLKARIYDNNGFPIETPQFIEADGTLRAPDANGNVKPIMMIVYPYEEADFNALNLGI